MATAFAVYCADDTSLTFYKRDTVPAAGATFEGKIATAVYTGVEESQYSNSTLPWGDVRGDIRKVAFADAVSPISTRYWFRECVSLTEVDIANLDTSDTTNMQSMFQDCASLVALDVSSLNTANVTSMASMFNGCSALKSLDLRNFNTGNVANMASMFRECSALATLNVTSFDTAGRAVQMNHMFYCCSSLVTLDLTSFDTRVVNTMDDMLAECPKLTTVYVSERWSLASADTYGVMFTNTPNIVGGNGTRQNGADYDDRIMYARIDTPETPGYFTYKPFCPKELRGDHIIQGETLYDIAEAIREKTGSTDSLTPGQMAAAIRGLGAN